uniref:DUF1664 domain-containing protein n=1 Tax=Araucaria cunninghamii TaxID=56994 RepID=A0A0D6QUD1_ARACU
MAMQAGMGFSKVLFLLGAGFAGSVALKNGRLSDILSEIQSLIVRMDERKGSSSGDSDNSAALLAQVRRLAQEVRHISSSRAVTVVNGNSEQSGNLASLAMPVAMLGALGYGYMWWKGFSFSDLMYVTKQNMTNVVASMTKHLDQVSAALAAAKRHLTQRIENLDEKMDEQKELSKLIKNEVFDVRGDLTQIGFDIDAIQKMVCGLEDKIGTLEDKQDIANIGICYLCNFVGGDKDGRMGNFLQNFQAKASKKLPAPVYSEPKSLKGLQYIADAIESGVTKKENLNAATQNEINDLDTKTPPAGATKLQKLVIDGASLSRTIKT